MEAADKTPGPTSVTATGAEPSELRELDAAERGFLLALMLAARDAEEVATRAAILAGPSAARCQRAAAQVAALSRPSRLRLLGQLAAEALAPVPAGIDQVDEDLLAELLARESAPVVGLLASSAPALSPLRRAAEKVLGMSEAVWREGPLSLAAAPPTMVAELQRAVLAPIIAVPPLDPADPPARRLGRRLATANHLDLLQALEDAGADLVGASLQGVVEATGPAPDRRQTLRRLGARAVGDRLGREDGDSVTAVAQRLPGDLRRELVAAAAASATVPAAAAAAPTPTSGRG